MTRLSTIIVRIAGLSIDHLESGSELTVSHIKNLFELSESLKTNVDVIRDSLFEVVCCPEITKSQRYVALELKRAVHNGRSPKLTLSQVEEIKFLLNPQNYDLLCLWLDNITQLQTKKKYWDLEFGLLLRQGARKSIINAFEVEGFTRALKCTAWDLYNQLQPIKHENDKSNLSSAERKVLTYISRATWKTSPKSSFMYSGRILLEVPEDSQRAKLNFISESISTQANPAVFNEIDRLRPLDLNSSTIILRHKRTIALNESVAYLRCNYRSENAGLWRSDQKSELMLGKAIIKVLFDIPNEGIKLDIFISELVKQDITYLDAQAVIKILFREGIIIPKHILNEEHQLFESKLIELNQILIEDGDKTNTRWMNSERLNNYLSSIRTELGISTAKTRVNDSRFEFGVAELSGQVLDIALDQCLTELEVVLKNYIHINPVYAALAKSFLLEFETESNVDLLTFLESFSKKNHQSMYVDDDWTNEFMLNSEHKVPVTVYFQVVSGVNETSIVINQAQTFSLSQCLRAIPEIKKDDYLEIYRHWLNFLYDPAEPIEVPMCNNCNGLQNHPSITNTILDWGNEFDYKHSISEIEDLNVSYDKSTHKFILTHKHTKKNVSLAYLGGVVAQPAWGLGYLLTILNNPFILDLPTIHKAESELLPNAINDNDKVIFCPRIQYGKVIIRRAFWIVKSSIFSEILKNSPSDSIINLYKYLIENGINLQLFIYPSSGGDLNKYYSQKIYRKPLYFDIFNPCLHETLLRVCRLSDFVVLVEAVPSNDALWLQKVSNQRRVSELQVEFALII